MPPSTATATTLMSRLCSQHPHDGARVEASLRIGLISALGLSLSVAHMPDLVPTNFRYLIGIMASSLALSVPLLLFSLTAALPAILFAFLIIMAAMTMLLTAASVSDGLYCTIFAIFTLFVCGLYFGQDFDKTAGNANMIIAVSGLFSLSFMALVQTNVIDPSDLWTQQGTQNSLAMVRNLMICTSWACGCIVVGILVPPLRTARHLLSRAVVPGALGAALQILSSYEEEQQQETTAADDTEQQQSTKDQSQQSAELPQTDESHDAEADSERKFLVEKATMVHLWNATQGGAPAKMVLFEPRFCQSPLEDSLVPPLTRLLDETSKVAMMMYGLLDHVRKEEKAKLLQTQPVQQWKAIVGACTQALLANDATLLQEFVQEEKPPPQKKEHAEMDGGALEKQEQPVEQDTKKETAHEESELSKNFKDEHGGGGKRRTLSMSAYLDKMGQDLLAASMAWLNAVNNRQSSGRGGLTNAAKTTMLWIVAPVVAPLKRFARLIVLPFDVSTYNLRSILWAVKLTAGFVALVVMTVYWEAYANYAIETGAHNVGGVFSGWQLTGYAFSWGITTEGTFKKGWLRLIGTCLGGFLAWLAAIVCSGSASNEPAGGGINPYGLVAFLTTVIVIVAYCNHEPGIKAYMGAAYDHGAAGNVLVSNMCLIALETYVGQGSRDELTVNRIVATLSGVAMAMVISVIPPFARGGDPIHALTYCYALKAALIDLLQTFLNETRGIVSGEISFDAEEYAATFCDEASRQRKVAFYLLKDAGTLRSLPIYRVDDRLKPLLEGLAMEETRLALVMGLATEFLQSPDTDELLDEESQARADLESILRRLLRGRKKGVGDDSNESSIQQKVSEQFEDPVVDNLVAGKTVDHLPFFIASMKSICHRLLQFEEALNQLPAPSGYRWTPRAD